MAEEYGKWISVKDSMPVDGHTVLLFVQHIEMGYHLSMGVWQLERTDPQDEQITFEDDSGQVTHWMPLPSPPKV